MKQMDRPGITFFQFEQKKQANKNATPFQQFGSATGRWTGLKSNTDGQDQKQFREVLRKQRCFVFPSAVLSKGRKEKNRKNKAKPSRKIRTPQGNLLDGRKTILPYLETWLELYICQFQDRELKFSASLGKKIS